MIFRSSMKPLLLYPDMVIPDNADILVPVSETKSVNELGIEWATPDE